eukprot:216672-Prymnesium_polylepis.2
MVSGTVTSLVSRFVSLASGTVACGFLGECRAGRPREGGCRTESAGGSPGALVVTCHACINFVLMKSSAQALAAWVLLIHT